MRPGAIRSKGSVLGSLTGSRQDCGNELRQRKVNLGGGGDGEIQLLKEMSLYWLKKVSFHKVTVNDNDDKIMTIMLRRLKRAGLVFSVERMATMEDWVSLE